MKTLSALHRTPPLAVGCLTALLALLGALPVLAQPSGCMGQNPGGGAAGSGLYAEYFRGYFNDDQTFFTRNAAGLVRTDARVDFRSGGFGDLTSVAANTLADPDNFSLRQRGSLAITTPGVYTFYLSSDDASFLWLGNTALASPAVTAQATIANGGMHSASIARQASLYLVAGLHNVLLHYGEVGSANTLVLEYEGPDAPTRRVVPASAFCTAVQPLRTLPANLRYPSSNQTVVAGTRAVSPVPTVTSPGAAQFALANAASLPAGIGIDAATGQLTFGPTVPSGLYQPNILVIGSEGATLFRQAYTFVAATVPSSAGCTSPRPDGGPPTQGLYTEYYSGFFNDNPAYFAAAAGLIRLEPQLNFATDASWGDLTPVGAGTGTNPDYYSARFRGSFTIATAGTYTLYLTSDDASWLWLDNAALMPMPLNSLATINNGGIHPDSTVAVTLPLFAGQHDLLIHYGETQGRNTLVLEYEGPDAPARQLMPASIFCSGSSGRPLATRSPGRALRVAVAPNPSRGSFEVRIGQAQPASGSLQLLDIRGRLCYQTNLPGATEQRLQLQLPNLAAGVYLLRLTTAAGTATHKVVME